MSTDEVPGLSPLESAVMSVLWDTAGALPTRAVRAVRGARGARDRLDCRWASYPPVAAVLNTLCRNGLAARDQHGRLWHYRACRSRERHLAALIRGALAAAAHRETVLRLALPQDTCPAPRPSHHHHHQEEEEEEEEEVAWRAEAWCLPGLKPSPEIDTTVAHSAQVWDYWLGGRDHYPADRQAGDQILSLVPELADSARASRYFLTQAVRYLAGQGFRQFLDIGPGLPCLDNTHEIAQGAVPESRIVYADNDPLVAAHGRAWRWPGRAWSPARAGGPTSAGYVQMADVPHFCGAGRKPTEESRA